MLTRASKELQGVTSPEDVNREQTQQRKPNGKQVLQRSKQRERGSASDGNVDWQATQWPQRRRHSSQTTQLHSSQTTQLQKPRAATLVLRPLRWILLICTLCPAPVVGLGQPGLQQPGVVVGLAAARRTVRVASHSGGQSGGSRHHRATRRPGSPQQHCALRCGSSQHSRETSRCIGRGASPCPEETSMPRCESSGGMGCLSLCPATLTLLSSSMMEALPCRQSRNCGMTCLRRSNASVGVHASDRFTIASGVSPGLVCHHRPCNECRWTRPQMRNYAAGASLLFSLHRRRPQARRCELPAAWRTWRPSVTSSNSQACSRQRHAPGNTWLLLCCQTRRCGMPVVEVDKIDT